MGRGDGIGHAASPRAVDLQQAFRSEGFSTSPASLHHAVPPFDRYASILGVMSRIRRSARDRAVTAEGYSWRWVFSDVERLSAGCFRFRFLAPDGQLRGSADDDALGFRRVAADVTRELQDVPIAPAMTERPSTPSTNRSLPLETRLRAPVWEAFARLGIARFSSSFRVWLDMFFERSILLNGANQPFTEPFYRFARREGREIVAFVGFQKRFRIGLLVSLPHPLDHRR